MAPVGRRRLRCQRLPHGVAGELQQASSLAQRLAGSPDVTEPGVEVTFTRESSYVVHRLDAPTGRGCWSRRAGVRAGRVHRRERCVDVVLLPEDGRRKTSKWRNGQLRADTGRDSELDLAFLEPGLLQRVQQLQPAAADVSAAVLVRRAQRATHHRLRSLGREAAGVRLRRSQRAGHAEAVEVVERRAGQRRRRAVLDAHGQGGEGQLGRRRHRAGSPTTSRT